MERKLKLRTSPCCQAEGTCSESGIDRFSVLPEEVVHHILSFLNFKDLTRVGAVSKRCRQFHLSVPAVNFGTNRWTDVKTVDLARLITSFDRYLLDRGNNRMQRVRIGLSSYINETAEKVSDDHSRAIKWIRNAVRCNVEELDLYFSHRASHFDNEYWKLQNLAFVHQLKEVSIENSYGSNEIEFERYILERAQNLKKMVIVHRDENAPSKVAGMMSRSKMISDASVHIQQDLDYIYTLSGPGIPPLF